MVTSLGPGKKFLILKVVPDSGRVVVFVNHVLIVSVLSNNLFLGAAAMTIVFIAFRGGP